MEISLGLIWIIYLVGIGFFFCELFVPGGFVGVLGFLFIAGAIGLGFYQASYLTAISMIISTVIIIPCVFFFALRRLSLNTELSRDQGFTEGQENLDLLGRVGTTLSPLRPSGTAEFDGRRYSVISEADMIDANERVAVIKVEGNRIFVRRVEN